MKSILFLVPVLCCMLLTAGKSEAADWAYNLTVDRVAVQDNCYIIDTNLGLSNCSVVGRIAVPATASNAKEIYATALTTFLTGNLLVFIMIRLKVV